MQQAELPMKDITPKPKTAQKVAAKAITNPKKKVAAKPKTTAVAVAQPQAPAQTKSVLQIIADAASNPAVNPTTMRELLDLQREITADQSKRDFNAAFIALQNELPSIRQDGKIEIKAKDARGERTGPTQQATPYASFNNIMKTIKPLLTRHGFALSFSTEPAGERLLVVGLLEGHGYERTTKFPLPAETSGSKNNVQGWGSSLSYGKRYCTIALLNIVSEGPEDRDTDGHQGSFKPAKDGGLAEVKETQTITEAQIIDLREQIDWCGVGDAKFLEHYGIKKLAELPADLFEAAKKACKDYRANQEAKKNG